MLPAKLDRLLRAHLERDAGVVEEAAVRVLVTDESESDMLVAWFAAQTSRASFTHANLVATATLLDKSAMMNADPLCTDYGLPLRISLVFSREDSLAHLSELGRSVASAARRAGVSVAHVSVLYFFSPRAPEDERRIVSILRSSDVVAFRDTVTEIRSVNWEIMPDARLGPNGFVMMSSSSIEAPTLSLLNLHSKYSALNDIDDVEREIPPSYRNNLKRCALRLENLLRTQLGFNVKDAIFTYGYGSRLVGNALNAALEQAGEAVTGALTETMREPAALLLVDRSLDWYSSRLDDDATSSVTALDVTLTRLGKVRETRGEIFSVLLESVKRGDVSPRAAFALGVRLASRLGAARWREACDAAPGDLQELAVCISSGDRRIDSKVTRVWDEASRLRRDLETLDDDDDHRDEAFGENEEEAELVNSDKIDDIHDTKAKKSSNSLVAQLLREIYGEKRKPRGLHRVAKLEVLKDIFGVGNFFSSAGARPASNTLDALLRARPNLVVFVLGGATLEDAEGWERWIPPGTTVYFGTNRILKDPLEDCIAGMNPKAEYVVKDLGKLFG